MNIDRILLIVVLLLAGWFAIQSQNKSESIKSKDSVIQEKNAKIKIIEQRNGKLVFEKQRAVADKETMSHSYGFLKDSLISLGAKMKQLESATFVATQTTGSGTTQAKDTVLIHDTLKLDAHQIRVSKPFFTLSGTLYPNNKFDYSYVISDSLALLNTVTRRNVFSKWEYTTRVQSANPDLRVIGLTSLTVKGKESKLDVSLFVGTGFGANGFTPVFIGVGVSRRLFGIY